MKSIYLALLCQIAVCCITLSAHALSEEYITGSNRVERLGWVNVDAKGFIANKTLTPEYLNERITVVLRWCYGCPGISQSVPAFENLRGIYDNRDIEFIHSYYPGQRHAKSAVLDYVRKFAITNAVYSGAAPAEANFRDEHRSVAVVLPGGKVVWSSLDNRIDKVQKLEQELKTKLNAWRRTSIETLWKENPIAAYEWCKAALNLELPSEDRDYYSTKPDSIVIDSTLAYISALQRLGKKNLSPEDKAFFKQLVDHCTLKADAKSKIKEYIKLQDEYHALVNPPDDPKHKHKPLTPMQLNSKKNAIAGKLQRMLKHKSFPFDLRDGAEEILKTIQAK